MKVKIEMEMEVSEGKSWDWQRIVGGQGFEGENKDDAIYVLKNICTSAEKPIKRGQLVLAWDGIGTAMRLIYGRYLSTKHMLHTIQLPTGGEVRRTNVQAVTADDLGGKI